MRDSERTRVYFESTALSFDSLYKEEDRFWYYVNHVFRPALYERVRLTVDEMIELRDFTVLDVGCGSGRNSVKFLKAGARHVVGIDFAESMLGLAKQYSAVTGFASQCDFVLGDALTYPFPQKFDVVVALGVFDYLREPAEMLRRMAGLASHKVIAGFPAYTLIRGTQRKVRYWLKGCPVYFQSQKQLRAICHEVGLDDYRLVPCGGAGYLLVARVGSRRFD
jgi:ubiquinone/menaquinone biosynthesis C-methylase UbiE